MSFRPGAAQCRNLIFSGPCLSLGDIPVFPFGETEMTVLRLARAVLWRAGRKNATMLSKMDNQMTAGFENRSYQSMQTFPSAAFLFESYIARVQVYFNFWMPTRPGRLSPAMVMKRRFARRLRGSQKVAVCRERSHAGFRAVPAVMSLCRANSCFSASPGSTDKDSPKDMLVQTKKIMPEQGL